MYSLDEDWAAGTLDRTHGTCVSLYQPTHRRHPQNQQDPVRFRNLLKSVEDLLGRRFAQSEVEGWLTPFVALAEDRDFWNHTQDGLAVLAATNFFRLYKLQRPVPELVIVADSFHTKPLMRILQSADRYQVLGLSRKAIRLFEGNRDVLDEIEPAKGVPRTMTEALGTERTEPHQTVASYGGVGPGRSPMRHGHGDRKSEVDVDTERFFRAVDRAVLARHSQPSGLPLILASLPEHHHLFREVSHNPLLFERAIDVHPDALSSIDELRERAWRLIEPRYLARLAGLVEDFGAARARGLGSDDLAEVARAIVAGRVARLLVDADRKVPGRVDASSGAIDFDDLADPVVDDLRDDLAAQGRSKDAEVVVVPAEQMPTESGIAATYRY